MSAQIALLRGVNLNGRKVVMSELRALCEKLGCTNVRTLLASGNVVLESKLAGAKLEEKLEKAIAAEFGMKTEVFVRSADELDAAIAANPFAAFAKKDPSHLVLIFQRAKLSAAEAKAVVAATKDAVEDAAVVGRDVYVTYPKGIGDSKLKLPVGGTARNWNTVSKLAALARS
jgi:uncharacterized protein (DUF1697 family)